EDRDRGAAPLPLLRSPLDQADIRGREGRLDPPASARVAVDPMAGDEIEHGIGRRTRDAYEMLPRLRAEHRDDVVRIVFETGNDLTAIAARCAPSRLAGFEDNDRDSGFGEMQGSGQARITGTDDRDVGLARCVDRGRL